MYWTELMKKILQSEMGRKIVEEVAPVYSDAYVALWLFEAIGEALGEMELWTEEYKYQLVPQTATWSLPMWERRYGLTTDASLTDEQRRRLLILRMSAGRTPMNPARLEKIVATAAGVESARIVEHTGSNQFSVFVGATPNLVDENKVRQALDNAKQAHLIYTIDYEKSAGEGTVYTGGVIQVFKDITLTQM